MDGQSICVGFEQVHSLGSAATNAWPRPGDCEHIYTTNQSFGILAHDCWKVSEVFWMAIRTCKHDARPRGKILARLLECGLLAMQPSGHRRMEVQHIFEQIAMD